jgi:hypothetical protein
MDDQPPIEDLTTQGITTALIRVCWKCGTFVTGVVALAVGGLYLKVGSIDILC